MCGIVGYLGVREALPILVNGIKRLEYRGYDSAGVAVINKGKLKISKAQGKIEVLENQLRKNGAIPGSLGISHTRWATHGEPSTRNAHPHSDCQTELALAHNGIIENYISLRELLVKDGHEFTSDTDTEVIIHLIEKHYDGDLAEAVRKAVLLLEGTYGIAVISAREPDVLVAARNGSPLIIGLGEGEKFVASDVAAIINYTRNVIYMEDGEIARITRDDYQTFTLEKKSVEKPVESVEWDIEQIEKGGFAHFMLKEIHEQKTTIEATMKGRLIEEEGTARLQGLNITEKELLNLKRVVFLACGTSWHSALVGEYMLEDLADIHVEVEYASEFRYRKFPPHYPGTIFIAVSQSGETADTLAALREAQRKGFKVLGISNVVGSTIARESDGGIYIHAGPEIGVASTKAFTSQVTAIALITLLMGRMKKVSYTTGKAIIEAMKKIPEQVGSILAQESEIKKIAVLYADRNNFLYLGRGYHFPIALEGALKMKEISYIHAEGYPAAEMKHGPIALIDENMPVVFIAPKDPIYEKVISNIEEVKARKGKIIAIASEGDKTIGNLADQVIYIPNTLNFITPLLSIIPLQLLAYHAAVIRGCDVDQPRNLAKSVTVE